MNSDLFLAILPMDSYNRGYGSGIEMPIGATRVGLAAILPDSEQRAGVTGGQAASFYAIAYDVSGANIVGLSGTVISYRGTDKRGALPWSVEGSDISTGWPLALGDYQAAQPDLALRFYQSVAGFDTGADPFAAAITTTGHSL